MYKIASDKRQSALHRGSIADWASGEEHITILQEYDAMCRRDKQFDEQMHAVPVGSEERQRLGKERAALQVRIKEMKNAVKVAGLYKARGNVPECFVEVAKEMLVPGQFKAMWAAAERRRDEHLARMQKILDGEEEGK